MTLDLAQLMERAQRERDAYAQAQPFPHAALDDFLPAAWAEEVLAHFPGVDSPAFKERSIGTVQTGKYGSLEAKRFAHAPAEVQHFLLWLNSYAMLYFLEALTGISNLLVDPYFKGGGLHQSVQGGKLNIHADFNYEAGLKLHRRINLLFYLNKNWQEDYGGQLELWDAGLTRCVRRIAPAFNRCVVFTTGSTSFHGHPQPLALPDGMTRKSIAAYYYTVEPPPGFTGRHETLWKTPRQAPG